MTKKTFVDQLEKRLKKYDNIDRKEIINYYNELIEDRIENGENEEDVIVSLGSIDMIIANLTGEKQVEPKIVEREKKISTPKVICLIVLSPLWFVMLITLFSLLIALVSTLFAIAVSLLSVFFSGVAYLLGSFILMFDNFYLGLIQFGLSLFLISLGVIFFKYGVKLIVYIFKKAMEFVKFLISKGGILIYE